MRIAFQMDPIGPIDIDAEVTVSVLGHSKLRSNRSANQHGQFQWQR